MIMPMRTGHPKSDADVPPGAKIENHESCHSRQHQLLPSHRKEVEAEVEREREKMVLVVLVLLVLLPVLVVGNQIPTNQNPEVGHEKTPGRNLPCTSLPTNAVN